MEALNEIVSALDLALEGTPLENFYEYRKKLKGGNKWNGPLLLVQRDADATRSGYAYHKGGRKELQFNVGFEDEGTYFRYGVAFSLEPGQDLPNPSVELSDKIRRFNQVISSFPELSSLKMWNYYGRRGNAVPIGEVPPNWIRDGSFVFFGERVPVPNEGIGSETVARAAKVLNILLPLYHRVEDDTAPPTCIGYRVARLCWNSDFWQGPTGRKGKSRNRKSYEHLHGFGHEEWLFNRGTLLDGWKYGFVQALNHSHAKYAGKSLGLLLYAIDGDTNLRYWAGVIDDAEVLTLQQAQEARSNFRDIGWLGAMRSDIEALGLDPSPLWESGGPELFNIRFRPKSLRVFDPPIPFPAEAVRSHYYGTLQKVPQAQLAILDGDAAEEELRERNTGKLKIIRHVYESTTEVDLIQAEWQEKLKKSLRRDLPFVKSVVETSVDGHRIDAVLSDDSRRVFVELKTRGTVRQIIRQALSQLLEYAYWPNSYRCDALLIVGNSPAGQGEQEYLRMLRKRFKLPVHYLHYEQGRIHGISEWWAILADQATA